MAQLKLVYTTEKPRRTRAAAWVILALLIVLFIPLFAGPLFLGSPRPSSRSRAASDIQTYFAALEMFHQDNARYPTTTEGLDALTKRQVSKGPYLVPGRLRSDPWGQPYIYRRPSDNASLKVLILSTGSDGVEGTADDISNLGW